MRAAGSANRASVSVVLTTCEGDLLLQLRDDIPGIEYPAYWSLVGGWIEAGESPLKASHISLTIEVLKRLATRRRTIVVAAADLAHMGPVFGDAYPLDRVGRATIAKQDQELINIMRSLRLGDFSVLQKMLLKASQYAAGSQVLGPWDTAFPQALQSLCLYSLHQFEPTSQVLDLLVQLHGACCTNIGHLVAFHPEACRLSRELDSRFWTKLTIAFSRVS